MFSWQKLRKTIAGPRRRKYPTPAAQRQALRDAVRNSERDRQKRQEPKIIIRRNSSPAFAREQARRDRAMMSSSFRRRMTWQQSLCLTPLINLPPIQK